MCPARHHITRLMTNRRKNTRKCKRRGSLRLDRLAIVLTPFVLIIGATIFFSLRSCRDDRPVDQPAPAQAETPVAAQPASTEPAATTPAAASTPAPQSISVSEAANRDAAAVEITAPRSMERQQALLDIHVRASRLQSAGYIHASDEYLSLVRSRLSEKGIL